MSLLGRLELVPRHANRDEVRHQRAPDGSGRAADLSWAILVRKSVEAVDGVEGLA